MIDPNVPQNNETNKVKAIQKAMSPSKQDHVHITKNPQTARERIDKKMDSYKDAKGTKEMVSPESKQKQRAKQHMEAVNPKSPILSASTVAGSIAKGVAEGAAKSLVPSQAQKLAKQAYKAIPKQYREAIAEGTKEAGEKIKGLAKDISVAQKRHIEEKQKKKKMERAINAALWNSLSKPVPSVSDDIKEKNISVPEELDPSNKYWKQMPDRMKAFKLMGLDEYLPIRYRAKVNYPRERKEKNV